jgi:uncharacterized membrane protein
MCPGAESKNGMCLAGVRGSKKLYYVCFCMFCMYYFVTHSSFFNDQKQQNANNVTTKVFFLILIFWSCVTLLYPLSYALILSVPNEVVDVVEHTMGEWW